MLGSITLKTTNQGLTEQYNLQRTQSLAHLVCLINVAE